MPNQWSDLEKIAYAIAKDNNSEMGWRVASRSIYYASYHLLKPIAQVFGDTHVPGSHAKIIANLKGNKSRDTQAQFLISKLGFYMGKLKIKREFADYHLDQDFKKEYYSVCTKSIQEINYLVNRIKKLENLPDKIKGIIK